MNDAKQRNEANRSLFLAAKLHTHPQFQNDEDAVKQVRDGIIYKEYGTHNYTDLSLLQMSNLIRKLYAEKGKNCKTFDWEYATTRQKSKLYRLAYQCSIEFTDFKKEEYVDKSNGVVYQGEELRDLLKDCFASYKIPRNLQIRLLTRWFNPKANKHLLSKGYKSSMPKDPSRFYFDYLAMGEASVAIR